MNNAIEKLRTTVPREIAGARSGARYAYQAHWALCHLLELHTQTEDYVVCLEHHDDVVDYFPERNKLRFFQVKTETKQNFTVSLLTQPRGSGDYKLSYLGKLYCNYLNFENETEGLFFVGNMRFSIALEESHGVDSTLLEKINLTDADAIVISEIKNKLKNELNLEDINLNLFALHVAALDVSGYKAGTIGQVALFLEKMYPDEKVPVNAFYRALIDKISKRSNQEYSPYVDDAEFLQRKAVSRDEVEKLLCSYKPNKYSELKDIFSQIAMGEGFSTREIINMSHTLDTLSLKMTPDNLALLKLKENIQEKVAELEVLSLKKLFSQLSTLFANDARKIAAEPLLKAVIWECYYDQQKYQQND